MKTTDNKISKLFKLLQESRIFWVYYEGGNICINTVNYSDITTNKTKTIELFKTYCKAAKIDNFEIIEAYLSENKLFIEYDYVIKLV